MEVYKVIRDSVHGNIELERSFVENILDTQYFQRLRRIEQTSVRAIYPCARHDRFTHSLGVYHVGTKIVDQLKPQVLRIEGFNSTQVEIITKSYLIACLLHDIAHAPFSHTFEPYYGDVSVLYKKLCDKLGKDLEVDPLDVCEIKPHELASAILVADKFKDSIPSPNSLGGDLELVCRMIIGAQYSGESHYYQVCNCFIQLLHGDVDADRLDYACRDVWSSGYKAVSIDINRVIHAMHILRYEDSYQLCFNHNVIGDIRNIMELKRFQSTHIFNHHTIVYDQELLVQAAETMALDYITDDEYSKQLSNIICLDAVIEGKTITNGTNSYNLRLLGDDDLYFLMKQNNNQYFQELSSRTYKRFALWKSPEEFYQVFPKIEKTINITNKNFATRVEDALLPLKKELLDDVGILTREVTYKERDRVDDMLILVHGKPVKYREVCHDIFKDTSRSREIEFTYLYIPKPKKMEKIDQVRDKAIDLVRPIVEELFDAEPSQDVITKIEEYITKAKCKVDITKTSFTKKEISQLERFCEKLKSKQDGPINNAAVDILELIISSNKEQEEQSEKRELKKRSYITTMKPAARIATPEALDKLNKEY